MTFRERFLKSAPAVVGVIIVGLILFVIFSGGQSSKSTHRSASSSGTTPTASSSQPSSSPTVVTHHQDVDSRLLTQLQTMVEAYYRYLPGEQPIERVSNLPAFVPVATRSQIEFFDLPKAGDELRISKQLTIRGTLINSTVEGYAVLGHPTQISVQGTALIDFVSPDGTIYSANGQQAESEAPFASVWQRGPNGDWMVVRFVDGGDQ